MRFPVDPLPVTPPAEDLYEIRERPPVTATRFVRARTLPPLILPPRRKAREQAAQGHPPAAQDTPAERLQTTGMPVTEERRRGDRRVAQVPVLLDTRSGIDRRRSSTGQGGAAIDIEV
ncbi:MAG: hypothetical protein RMK60_06915 [Burkholderiales bacterium]|nr:hypothetical protein [Burkholderiales bacterium]